MASPSGTTNEGAPAGEGPAAGGPAPPRDLGDARRPVRLRYSAYSIVRAVLIVVVALVVLTLVQLASTTLWWLAIASVIAAMFQPAVLLLQRYMRGWIAIVLVLVGVLGAIGLVGYRGFAEVRSQFETVQANAIAAARDIEASNQFGQVATEFGLTSKVQSFFETVPLSISGTDDAASAVQTAASSGGALFAIAMLALLMLIFGPRLVGSAVNQIDNPMVAARVRALIRHAYDRSARYAWLMAARAFVVGIVTFAICSVAGMQTPTAIGLWFALLSLLPGFGLVLAALPLIAFQAITSAPSAMGMTAGIMLVQLADIILVQRRIEAHSTRVGPAVTLIAALIGLQLYGIGGMMVMLATVIFALAALRALTRNSPDAFTAVRELVTVRSGYRVGE